MLPNQGRVPLWQAPQVPPELGSRWKRTREPGPELGRVLLSLGSAQKLVA